MSRILVTGACGFLGSHICEYFKSKNWNVVGYDNLTKFEYARSNYNIQKVRDYNLNYLKNIGISVIIGDIRDYEYLEKVMDKGNFDLVMNCAAQPAMTIATENPLYDFNVNAMGSLNILDLCKKYSVGVLTCSTIHVYGNGINDTITEKEKSYFRYPIEINESHPLLTGKITPLHASKITMENYFKTYADSYGLKAGVFRLTGIYGERQTGTEDHAWMSLLAIKALLNKPIMLIGNGKQVRDPIYAKDVCGAVEQWYKSGMPSGVFNIGGSLQTKISVLEYLAMLEKITGNKINLEYGNSRMGDLLYYVSDISKANKELGWYSKTALEIGVTRLVNWLKDNLDMFTKE